MNDSRYANVRFVALEEYIPAHLFRTVLPDMLKLPCGPAELLTEIAVSEAFAGRLPFETPWDGIIYGYTTAVTKVAEALGKRQGFRTERVYLNDWGGKFLLTLEDKTRDGIYQTYFVTPDEVNYLLTHCRLAKNL
jgi:hypothetical protein